MMLLGARTSGAGMHCISVALSEAEEFWSLYFQLKSLILFSSRLLYNLLSPLQHISTSKYILSVIFIEKLYTTKKLFLFNCCII